MIYSLGQTIQFRALFVDALTSGPMGSGETVTCTIYVPTVPGVWEAVPASPTAVGSGIWTATHLADTAGHYHAVFQTAAAASPKVVWDRAQVLAPEADLIPVRSMICAARVNATGYLNLTVAFQSNGTLFQPDEIISLILEDAETGEHLAELQPDMGYEDVLRVTIQPEQAFVRERPYLVRAVLMIGYETIELISAMIYV